MMRLHNGDCLNVLKMMIEDEVFVDSIVTDPPYELGFMGRSWDSTGIAFQKETWELCFKVLKPGGHLLAFSGSRTYHRMAVAIEDAGFEIRDQVMWLYGSGFPKSMNIGKALDKKLGNERIKTGEKKTHSNKGIKQSEQRTAIGAGAFGQEVEEDLTVGTTEWEGWGTALKPAHEPLVLARKPISENSVVDNVLKHRTGGINIDDCRVEGNDANYPDSNPVMNGGKYAQNENAKRKMVVRKTRTDDSVFNNGNSSFRAEGTLYADADPRGRFPSNIMHDGSDSIKELFEDKSRYFYCAKTSKVERNQGLDNLPTKKASSMPGRRNPDDMKDSKIDNDVTGRFVTEKKNIHPTVKPIKLMKYLCRLITPKGGTVLDPFMGSGSTGIAAKDEGFEFIGIEKEKEYFEIAERRISVASPLEEFMK